jgi:hypothetical protein
VVGKLFAPSHGGAIAIRYDSAGNVMWEVRPESVSTLPQEGTAAAATVDKQGNLYIAVNSLDRFGSVTCLKYDPSGHLQWRVEDRVAKGRLDALAMDIDWRGQVVIGASLHAGRSGYTITKISPNGRERKTIVFEARKKETLHASEMKLDHSGNVYMTGLSIPRDGGPHRHATVKFDASDRLVWRFDVGGSRRSMLDLPHMAVSPRQEVAVSGMTRWTYLNEVGRPVTVMEPTVYLFR